MADIWAYCQTANLPSTVTTFDVTISGIGTPKAVMVFALVAGAGSIDGTVVNNDIYLAIGACDDVNQWSQSCATDHGQDTTDSHRKFDDTLILRLITGDGLSFYEMIATGGANSAGPIEDGWKFDVTAESTGADTRPILVVFFGGADLEVDVDTSTMDTTGVDVTAPGFEPDIVFVANTGTAAGAAISDHADVSFGVVHNSTSVIQRMISYGSRDAQGASDVYSETRNDEAGSQLGLTGSNSYVISLSAFDANGFTVTTDINPSTDEIGFLALRDNSGAGDASFWVGSVDSPVATGSDWTETGPGFQPEFALLGIDYAQAENVIEADADAALFGVAMADETREFSGAIADEDGQDTSDCYGVSDVKFLTIMDPAGSKADGAGWQADTLVFNANGWTIDDLNIDASETIARKWFGFAMRGAAVGGGLSPPFPTMRRANQQAALVR